MIRASVFTLESKKSPKGVRNIFFFRLQAFRLIDIYNDYEGLTCELALVNNRKCGAHVTILSFVHDARFVCVEAMLSMALQEIQWTQVRRAYSLQPTAVIKVTTDPWNLFSQIVSFSPSTPFKYFGWVWYFLLHR